jgi:hypothetical protein
MNIAANLGKITIVTIVGVLILVFSIIVLNGINRVDAGEILVAQGPTGSLTVYTDPGYKILFFNKTTYYKKSFQYWFSKAPDQGGERNDAIPIRFNDGATGTISGGVRIDMPEDTQSILAINATFGNQEAVEQQLIRPVIEKSVTATGPLMSSKESYAEKRADLMTDIEDQAKLGVYQTTTTETLVKDDLTNEQKQVNLVQIVKDGKGLPLRQEDSPLTRFNVKLYNLSLNGVEYSDAVEAQIKAQQEATQAVQTAMATAKKAEQDAITAEKEGEATATKAKWDQETINATTIATQEGAAKAAEFTKEAAALQKDATILAAEGEAEAKKLRTQANNNLDQRLEAYIKVNQAYADSLSNMKVPVVPGVIMGSGQGGGSSVQDLIQLLQVKTARDLSLDMNMTGASTAQLDSPAQTQTASK